VFSVYRSLFSFERKEKKNQKLTILFTLKLTSPQRICVRDRSAPSSVPPPTDPPTLATMGWTRFSTRNAPRSWCLLSDAISSFSSTPAAALDAATTSAQVSMDATAVLPRRMRRRRRCFFVFFKRGGKGKERGEKQRGGSELFRFRFRLASALVMLTPTSSLSLSFSSPSLSLFVLALSFSLRSFSLFALSLRSLSLRSLFALSKG